MQRAWPFACSFDRSYAASLGYRPGLIDALLLCLVAATVVVAILAVGNVLALALPDRAGRDRAPAARAPRADDAARRRAQRFVALELSYWVGLAASSTVVLCSALWPAAGPAVQLS